MKIRECSCSLVFAVFNNFNETRVRSDSIFFEKFMFVFDNIVKEHVCVRSYSEVSPKIRVRVLSSLGATGTVDN